MEPQLVLLCYYLQLQAVLLYLLSQLKGLPARTRQLLNGCHDPSFK